MCIEEHVKMKKNKLLLLLVAVFAFTLFLVACDGDETAEPQTENPPVVENPVDDEIDEEEIEQVVSLSGTLTVYMPAPGGLADDLAAAFTAETGVAVDVFQGTTGEILARLEAEAANPIADVVILASWSDGLGLREQGGLHSFVPEFAGLIHPAFMTDDHTMFGTSASAVGVAYNTTLFDSVSGDWSDFASAEFLNQLVMPDPALSGSANDFLAGFIYDQGEAGWDVWNALADNGMIVPGANGPSLEAVVTGERGILISAVDWNVFNAINNGEPLGFFYPTSGTVINPRPAMILETSSNIDAAVAFVNFLMSDTAQQMVIERFLIPGRSDIRSDLRPNVDEITVLDTDWDWMMNNATEISGEFNGFFE